jgi:hypothetical protein
VKSLNLVSAFLDRHKVTAAVVGGFLSVTLGATYWLASGGAVAIITSMRALSTPEIAVTLEGLPDYHSRSEAALGRLEERLVEQGRVIQQMADTLDSLRAATTEVVEWAPEHSQRLTDAAGGCFAGQTDCPVYFRGRRTQAGAACELTTARPRLVLTDGREYPIRFSPEFEPVRLGTDFETIEVLLQIPEFIPPGLAGVVILTFYGECPFVSPGELIERETFRLLLEVLPAPEGS